MVYDTIKSLNPEQNIIFALSCINRIKQLPQLFINSYTYGIEYLDKIIPKNTIENILNETLDKIIGKNIKKAEINKNIELLDKLLLDDDIENRIEKQLFSHYVIILIHILEYINEHNNKYIELCSDNMVEIINQIKGEKYELENNLVGYIYIVDDKYDEYVDRFIDEEIKIEMEIIERIKGGNTEMLDEYIENKKIEYNNIKEPVTNFV